MDPIFIILLAVFTTTIISLVFARRPDVSPRARRMLWLAAAAGVVALVGVVIAMAVR